MRLEESVSVFEPVSRQHKWKGGNIGKNYHVMMKEALNSGIIANQYLNMTTNEIEVRIASLTTLYTHYLP